MSNRYHDWLKQAEKDLRHASSSIRESDFEWACFASQQEAEKALKALFLFGDKEIFGNSLKKMLQSLPEKFHTDEMLITKSNRLDKLYMCSRYPDSFDSGAPMDFFTREDATNALIDAEEILRFAKKCIGE